MVATSPVAVELLPVIIIKMLLQATILLLIITSVHCDINVALSAAEYYRLTGKTSISCRVQAWGWGVTRATIVPGGAMAVNVRR